MPSSESGQEADSRNDFAVQVSSSVERAAFCWRLHLTQRDQFDPSHLPALVPHLPPNTPASAVTDPARHDVVQHRSFRVELSRQRINTYGSLVLLVVSENGFCA